MKLSKNYREGYNWGERESFDDFLQPKPEKETFETYFRREEPIPEPRPESDLENFSTFFRQTEPDNKKLIDQNKSKKTIGEDGSHLGKIIILLIIWGGIIILLYELGLVF